MMNSLFSRVFFVLVFLLCASIVGSAQATQNVIPKPTAYTTAPKVFIAKLKKGEQNLYDITGNISFTITAANSDDTVVGTVNYAISDDSRQKIAALIEKPLASVPDNITRRDVIANFVKDTAPPVIRLLISTIEMEIAGGMLQFSGAMLDINARSVSTTTYTTEEVEALLTLWARQILNDRPRRGIIFRLNRVIKGER